MVESRLTRKPNGRPRDPKVDREILKAAERLLRENGYAALSIEAVALRAGVAKTTVYRRWNSRLELVAEVLSLANARWPMPTPLGGSVRDDLMNLQHNWIAGMSSAGRVIPSLIAEAVRNEELAALLQGHFVKPRRALAIEILDAARAKGELPRQVDPTLAIDMFMGRLWYRLLITGDGLPDDDAKAAVDLLLDGLHRVKSPKSLKAATRK